MRARGSFTLGVAVALAFGVGAASADPPKPQYTAKDVVDALTQSTAQPNSQSQSVGTGDDSCVRDASGVCEPALGGQRGFSLVRPHSSSHADTQSYSNTRQNVRTVATPVRAPVHHFNLLVTFKVASSELTDQARVNVRQFADALSSPALASRHFELAGYTDASGDAERNLQLSQARAGAVKDYLVSLNIDPSRLDVHGYGARDFIDQSKPYAPENRRVVVRPTD